MHMSFLGIFNAYSIQPSQKRRNEVIRFLISLTYCRFSYKSIFVNWKCRSVFLHFFTHWDVMPIISLTIFRFSFFRHFTSKILVKFVFLQNDHNSQNSSIHFTIVYLNFWQFPRNCLYGGIFWCLIHTFIVISSKWMHSN